LLSIVRAAGHRKTASQLYARYALSDLPIITQLSVSQQTISNDLRTLLARCALMAFSKAAPPYGKIEKRLARDGVATAFSVRRAFGLVSQAIYHIELELGEHDGAPWLAVGGSIAGLSSPPAPGQSRCR
jgi:hypothetical protein